MSQDALNPEQFPTLYRGMSHEEYEGAHRSGHIKSDQRWDRQSAIEGGYEFPNYGTSASDDPAIAKAYGPVVVQIEHHPDENWRMNPDALSDGMREWSTHNRIPMTRVRRHEPQRS